MKPSAIEIALPFVSIWKYNDSFTLRRSIGEHAFKKGAVSESDSSVSVSNECTLASTYRVVCVCVCVCNNSQTHTHTHTHTYICKCVYVRMRVCVCACACVLGDVSVGPNVVKESFTHVRTHTRSLFLLCVCVVCVPPPSGCVCRTCVFCVCVTFLRGGAAELAVVAEADYTSTIAVRCHFHCCIFTAEPVLQVPCAITYDIIL